MKRVPLAFIASLLLALGVCMTPSAASAAPQSADCGQHWPSDVWADTWTDGHRYTSSLHFRLTDAELSALHCTARDFLEIEWVLEGFNLPDQWRDYNVYSNTPGFTRDVAFLDSTPAPAATAIEVWNLRANTDYVVQLEWWADPSLVSNPAAYINWVPSGWGEGTTYFGDYAETLSCAWGIMHDWDKGWCVFPITTKQLVGDVYAGPLPFNGYGAYTLNPMANSPTY